VNVISNLNVLLWVYHDTNAVLLPSTVQLSLVKVACKILFPGLEYSLVGLLAFSASKPWRDFNLTMHL